ncbi:MAG: MBL fold metallo-hydrolase [Dehalococcoidia bacterium]|nr:MAG: MBL fold metallo-hydrolase [Dehalococcoidia bacterium]
MPQFTESAPGAQAILDRGPSAAWWLTGVRGANVYLVRLPSGSYVLVDAGLPGSDGAIVERLRALGVTSVEAILLTHSHPDHAGAAARLREALGARVVLGAGDVRDGRVRGDRRIPANACAVDLALPAEECEPLPGVLAIPFPGHTAGSTVYAFPSLDLWCIGDIALHSGDRMSRPIPPSNDDTPAQERALQALAARVGLNGAPGHGDPVIGTFDVLVRALASRPPASGPWWLRILLNPRVVLRFARRQAGRH